jgi:hypothetical protein
MNNWLAKKSPAQGGANNDIREKNTAVTAG